MRLFRPAGFKETAVLLALAWLIPFAVHLLPWGGATPLGAHLLPMFWAAFAAVYLFGLRAGLLTGLFAPIVNLAVTGLPALGWLSLLSFELVVFVALAWWSVRRVPWLWLIAPFGYLVARVGSAGVQTLLPGGAGAMSGLLFNSLRAGWPGLVVLAALNFALVRLYPKDGSGHDAPGV
ncbi:MAG: hypothetical protein ACHQ4G_11295 [Opitutales bacterium]